VSQLVYDFGGVNASLKSNEEKTEALILESRLQQSQMLLSLIRSYLEWARASYRLQMSEDFVSTREQFLDLVKSRESIGGSSRADVIRAETKLIEALDELPFSVKAVEQANASLVEMYGAIPESVQLFQTPLLGDEMQRHETTGLYPIKIQAIDKSIASAKAQLRAAEIRRYGVIRFDGTYQNVNDPIFNTSESTRLQLSYQVDIFSGYAQNARIDQARFQLSELEAERDRVKKEQARVLSVAFADYRSQVASTRSRVKLVRAAKRASDITRELFVFNRGSISDIFKAQEDYLSASRNLLDTMINAQLSYYTLLHERGYLLEKFELTL
jgi:adhesin transport system outer membrane protein